MQAVVFHSFGKADVLEITHLATPVTGENDILVRVRAAAVNPKDIFIRKGFFETYTGSNFPMRTGFDFSGEVAAVGSHAQGVEPGMAVFGMTEGWIGGTCAQYITVPPRHLSRKPRNLTFAEAAALPLVSLTVLQALTEEAHIGAGSRICINGASGGVGTMAVQIAKRLGATVTAVSSPENHAVLTSLGADVCIDYHQTDITRSRLIFDIFFDVFGNRLFETVQPILAPDGTWVSTVLRPEVKAAVEQTRNATGQQARQVFVRPDGHALAMVRRWAEKKQIKPVIHAIFPMARIGDAHRQQETKHTRGKVVISIP